MQRRGLFAAGAGLALAGSGLTVPTGALAAAPARSLMVEAVQMPAWTTHRGQSHPLSPGMSVTNEHEIETAPSAGLALRLPEGSLVTLGESTRLGISRLEVGHPGGRTAVQAELKVFDGFFRFATSTVSKLVGERRVNVALRTATIGIRGTDFWAMTDKVHDATCLFEGRVELSTPDQGALALDRPTAFWARFFEQAPKPVGLATPDELAKFLKSTELGVGKGVAVLGGRWCVVAAASTRKSQADALVFRLRDLGYPAVLKVLSTAAGGPRYETRINACASQEDATAVLQKISGVEGVNGRVAADA